MRHTRTLAALAATAALAAGCGSQATAAHVTHFKTRTVTQYKTHTVYKTPPSCLQALEDMRQVSGQLIQALKLAESYSISASTRHVNKASHLITLATPLYTRCAVS